MTIKEGLVWAKKLLIENEVEGPVASAEFLMRQVLTKDRTFLATYPEKKLTKLQELKFRKWVKRRAKHEPVWYITKKIDFLGLDLSVSSAVLIPRPETELMIEKILDKIEAGVWRPEAILDVGTGSGAIILSLAKNLSESVIPANAGIQKMDGSLGLRPGMTGFFASDISAEALKMAIKNAESLFPRHSRAESSSVQAPSGNPVVEFRQGDLFAPWQGEKFDLIVANLPYIPHEDMATLAFDLTHYEPRVALDGGIAGLEVYKKFIQELPDHLNPGAKVYMEIGYDQGRYIKDFVKKYLPKAKVEVLGDYAQIDRIVIIET